MHDREEPFTHFFSKLPAEPCLIMVVDALAIDTVDIPCHVEEEFQVVACYLWIMYVGYPELAYMQMTSRGIR